MKARTLIPATIVALIVSVTTINAGAQKRGDARDFQDRDLPERDEIHQTYQLTAGASVEVRGINGTVDIETSDGGAAQVDIVRSARTREDLEYHKILIDQTASSLVVRGENDKGGDGRRDVRQRVMLKLPSKVALTVSGVNGRTNVGEIDGPVRLNGINGRVDVAQAVGHSEISGINGHVKVTIARLSEQGIHVSGVNGAVELQFADEVNADLDVTGINGTVQTDLSNVTLLGKLSRQNFHAKIGSGGSPIKVNGINGPVKLSRTSSAG
jgi:hypothetical protein